MFPICVIDRDFVGNGIETYFIREEKVGGVKVAVKIVIYKINDILYRGQTAIIINYLFIHGLGQFERVHRVAERPQNNTLLVMWIQEVTEWGK